MIPAAQAELAPWLRLSQVPGVGTATFIRLLQACGSPEAVLAASSSILEKTVPAKLARAILASDATAYIDQVHAWLAQPGNRLITLADSAYPPPLLQLPDPPPILYAKGNTALLNRPALAIVGSRNATAQGMENARQFARHLSDAGLTIVSGMAAGIDRAAHEGGLKGAAGSIAVIGTGQDRVYPAANRDLAHQLAGAGLILSEFALGTQPLAANFPRRNRIISGLSLGVLVVECALNSGTQVTARLAAEQGREVMAIPGSIHSPLSRGCHALIKQGAKLVETAADILEELHWQAGSPPACSPAEARTPACDDDAPLLDALGHDAATVDTLCQRSGLTADRVCAILLRLELEGLVSCLPGGRYQRIHTG